MAAENIETTIESEHVYTREELEAFVTDIECKVTEGSDAAVHSIFALNHLLREPNAKELIDDEIKARMADLWIKFSAAGFDLNNPPLLFGDPELPHKPVAVDDSIDDGTEAIVITLPPEEDDESKAKDASDFDEDDSLDS
jgi:hypothetical protein